MAACPTRAGGPVPTVLRALLFPSLSLQPKVGRAVWATEGGAADSLWSLA